MYRWIKFVVCAFLLGFTPSVFGQQLNISLEAPSKPVKRGAKHCFKVSITNVSTQEVWIYKDLFKGVEIWIKNKAGRDLEHSSVGALCPPPPPTPEDFLCLKPGQSVSVTDDRSPAELGVKRRGKFRAIASYYYQVEVASGAEKILHLIDHPLESSPIEFEAL
ncbi:hypothetical protein [Geothrix limicola]|uniref:hypothetical protein n=1 Tax=Geothrix limicola TaxID=2927978 RepID=UPI0025571DE7|nr:hypothetical protein [Geothrix limicola]